MVDLQVTIHTRTRGRWAIAVLKLAAPMARLDPPRWCRMANALLRRVHLEYRLDRGPWEEIPTRAPLLPKTG